MLTKKDFFTIKRIIMDKVRKEISVETNPTNKKLKNKKLI